MGGERRDSKGRVQFSLFALTVVMVATGAGVGIGIQQGELEGQAKRIGELTEENGRLGKKTGMLDGMIEKTDYAPEARKIVATPKPKSGPVWEWNIYLPEESRIEFNVDDPSLGTNSGKTEAVVLPQGFFRLSAKVGAGKNGEAVLEFSIPADASAGTAKWSDVVPISGTPTMAYRNYCGTGRANLDAHIYGPVELMRLDQKPRVETRPEISVSMKPTPTKKPVEPADNSF